MSAPPTDSESRSLADIAASMRAGNFVQASHMADTLLAGGLVHPLPYQARALHLEKLGRGDEALANLREARSLSPNDPMIANGIAICLGRMGRLKDAMAAFETALALDPNLVTTYFHMGWVLEMHRDFIGAREAYKRAVEMAPQYAAAWAGLATTAESIRDWEDVRIAAARALAIDPRQPRIILSLAFAEIQALQFKAAEVRLRAALQIPGFVPHPLRTAMLGLLADALDGQNKTEEAFAFYTAENDERRKTYLSSMPQLDMAVLVRGVTAHFQRTYPSHWSLSIDDSRNSEDIKEHIFLLGFPRSGTTLLEQVLSAHPDVITLEESDVLDASAETFLRDIPGLDRLAALCGDDLAQTRRDYWRRVRGHGLDVKGRVFVDKLPLNTIKLPLIAKLFPRAKVIFSLRDPRDVVFSCFRRHFQVNASTGEFLTLQGAARYYDSVMTLGENCRQKLPLSFHCYRHEDLVQDFEGEVRRLCAFVGIDWADRVRDFAEIAQRRNIRSISALQVRRGLYSDGAGQWRRYAMQLEPILFVLQPWVEKFGYEPT